MRNRLRRRVLAAGLAVTLALVALPSAAAGRASSLAAYEHLWRPETMLGGDRGSTAKNVSRSEVTLSYAGNKISGKVFYTDLLGMRDGSGTWSQSAEIELALDGAFVQPGRTVGGTFEGTAVLLRRSASGLEDAVSPDIELRSDGIQAVYAVSGHWGGTVSNGLVAGEILYERVELVRTSHAEATPAGTEWFARAGARSPGDPQTFSAALSGAPAEPDTPSSPDGAGGNDAGRVPSAAERAWRYISRGLAGAPTDRVYPVSPDALRAARALRDANPTGATPLPSSAVAIDLDVSGAYLDALNRAAGLLPDEGCAGFEPLAEEWARARRNAPPVGVPVGGGVGAYVAADLVDVLEGHEVAGADALARQAADIAAKRASAMPEEVATWLQVARTVAATRTAGDVVRATRDAVTRVREARLPEEGPERDAVLAAADNMLAPESALAIARFAREPSADTAAGTATQGPARLVAEAAGGARIEWIAGSARATAEPVRWLAYHRGDGRLFWLAEPGGAVALTDATLRGWAFTTQRAWLVEPTRVGRVLAEYPAPTVAF